VVEEAPAGDDLADLSDDDLAGQLGDALAVDTEEAAALADRLTAELDAREQAAKLAAQQAAQRKAARDAARATVKEQQAARISALINDQGWAEAEAVSEVTGKALPAVQRQLAMARMRSDGLTDGRSFEAMARKRFKEAVSEDRVASESLLRGGNELNKAGIAAGRNPDTLWTGSEAYARKWASPELLQWWDEHGRRTYADFREQLLTGTSTTDIKRGTWLR
jgi:hypothetical protein